MTIEQMDPHCHACGQPAMVEETAPRDHTVGKRTVRVDEDRHLLCRACGAIRYEGPHLAEAQHRIAAAIRREDGLLTPDELRAVRLKYGLTQTDMEQLLGTGPKTWTRWERGKVVQSAAADRLIRVIATNPDALRDLMADRAVTNPATIHALDEIDADVARRLRARLEDRFSGLPAHVLDELAGTVSHEMRAARRDFSKKDVA